MILSHGELMNESKRRDIAFLILIVLAVYFPAITNTINSIDDVHIIKAYAEIGQRTLQKILLPGDQFYFRPLIELTYYLDNFFWGLDPGIMHLENIFLHILNVIMVYLVAAQVSVQVGKLPYLPLTSALLFAVHPVNTEAVSWIAGRTDPIAAFFVLVSMLFLLKFIQLGLTRYFAVSFAAMLLACLAKETSAMLLPVSAGFMYLMRPLNPDGSDSCRKRLPAVMYLLLCAALAGYIVVRLYLKPGGSENAFTILQQGSFDSALMLKNLLVTAGFYIKKFFIPFPLNFAIDTVSVWYVIPGTVALLAVAYILRRRTILLFFLGAGLVFLVPAIVVRLAALNWTPVAERYLYIPAAFISIGVTGIVIRKAVNSGREKLFFIFIAGVVIFFAGATFNRNVIWRDNLSLYRDAVAKSPEFGDIHNELGIELLKRGDCTSARKHFEIAMKRSTRPLIRELAELNMLSCEMEGKPLVSKKEIIRRYVASHDTVQPELIRFLRNVTNEILRTEPDVNERVVLMREIISLNDKLFQMVRDPYCLYSNGQLMLALGDKPAALGYFRKTVTIAASDVFYFDSAKKLITNLEMQ